MHGRPCTVIARSARQCHGFFHLPFSLIYVRSSLDDGNTHMKSRVPRTSFQTLIQSHIPTKSTIFFRLIRRFRILTNLLTCKPKDLKNEIIGIMPALSWLESTKMPLLTILIPYVSSILRQERAQIASWFDIHITRKGKKLLLS